MKTERHIVDNFNLIKEKVLDFQSSDDFYMMSILQRKKDHPLSGANENCRMLANFYIKNVEYYERKIPAIIDYCHHFQARAYIRPQVRSCLSCNRIILKYMADQIDNNDLAYATLTRTLIAGYHDSRAKRVLLDLDDMTKGETMVILDAIVDHFKELHKDHLVSKVFCVPTFSGYHIVSPGFDPRILTKFGFDGNVWKSDADTLVYGEKDVTVE